MFCKLPLVIFILNNSLAVYQLDVENVFHEVEMIIQGINAYCVNLVFWFFSNIAVVMFVIISIRCTLHVLLLGNPAKGTYL